MAVTLYSDEFWISPYVFSCFVALLEKGVPFETRDVFLGKGEQRQPSFRDASLTAKVPALDHDGFWVAESMAILEYVEEAWPAPQHPRILPGGLRDRARARQLLSWTRSDLGPLKEARPTTTMFYERATTPLSGPAREAADKVLRVSDRLVAQGATTLFDQWCIADADLSFILHRLILNGDEVPPKLRTYAEATWTRPSVKAFLDHPRRPYTPHP